jgi:hypothetical protein
MLEPGTMDVIELALALIVKIALGLAIVRWDERRLARKWPDLDARAWPPASRLSAVVVFQELGLVVHFWRTRRWGAGGLALGLVAGAALVLLTGVVLEVADALLS